MDFGFSLPPRGPMAAPENIATLAQQGEAMGFGIIAVTDHIIFPKSIQSTYPGSASGQYYAAGIAGGVLEALNGEVRSIRPSPRRARDKTFSGAR